VYKLAVVPLLRLVRLWPRMFRKT